MLRVAVTGASGFIGGHLMEALKCYEINTFAAGRNTKILQEKYQWAHAVDWDLASPPNDCFVKLGCPDVLIHLAWGGLPNYKSSHHVHVELPRQLAFLRAMVDSGLPTLLVTGTCFEYGMQSGALSEGLPANPENEYGKAKNSLREALQQLAKSRRFALTWARLFYTYGEGQSRTSLFPQLLEAVKRGEPVFNMSGGEQLRDYLPAKTVAQLLATIAINHPDAGLVNVCSGHPVTVRSLVEGWISEYQLDITLNLGHFPYPDYEPMAFWGDKSYLTSLIQTTGHISGGQHKQGNS